jgi:transcriptional regulator with XRE-family HTH domain
MVIQLGHEPDPAKRIRKRQGSTIKQVRKLREYDRAELAEKVGVTLSAVTQWENGTTTPRQHHQLALARVLDVPHAMLFGLDIEAA